MSEWINATNKFEEFAKAVKESKPVYAEMGDGTVLIWTPQGKLEISYDGKYDIEYSSFPGLFKKDQFEKAWDFYKKVKETING